MKRQRGVEAGDEQTGTRTMISKKYLFSPLPAPPLLSRSPTDSPSRLTLDLTFSYPSGFERALGVALR